MAIRSKKSKAAIQRGVDKLEPFQAASMSGKSELDGMGILPDPYREQLATLAEHNTVDYVIYSYKTPIAWHCPAGTWVIPDITYSVTTTGHQHIVRVAVDNPGFYGN